MTLTTRNGWWDVCDCPELPVNVWYRNGAEVHRRELTEVTGASDRENYLALGCDFWVVLCPTCGLVYATNDYA